MITTANHVWHRRSDWFDLCGELIPLRQVSIRVADVSNVDHHVDVFKVPDDLVSSVQRTGLEVVELI